MRAMRKLTNGIKKYVWDVFERPYWSWDVYERPVYVWDVYETVATSWEMTQIHEEDLAGLTFNVPYTGGYYRGGYHSFSSTLKHSIDSNGRSEITSEVTASNMTNDLFSTQAGFANLDVLYKAPSFIGSVIKNETLGRFEITNCQYAWGVNPLTFTKGETTGNTVSDFSNTAFPANGYHAATGLYYVRRALTLIPTGNVVESFTQFTYPLNGYDMASELYYIRTGYIKTPTGEIVKSQYPAAYPALGYDEISGYWYEKRAMS